MFSAIFTTQCQVLQPKHQELESHTLGLWKPHKHLWGQGLGVCDGSLAKAITQVPISGTSSDMWDQGMLWAAPHVYVVTPLLRHSIFAVCFGTGHWSSCIMAMCE